MKTHKSTMLSISLLLPLLVSSGCANEEASKIATREELDAYAQSVAPEELKQVIDAMVESKKSDMEESE